MGGKKKFIDGQGVFYIANSSDVWKGPVIRSGIVIRSNLDDTVTLKVTNAARGEIWMSGLVFDNEIDARIRVIELLKRGINEIDREIERKNTTRSNPVKILDRW